MKATVRVLISVLALVVAGAVTAPAAAAQSPATQHPTTAVMAAPAVAGAVVSVGPARIADSRVGLQIPGAVAALGTARVQVTGRGGIPGGGVALVMATVTVVAPQQAGYLTVWPAGTTRPDTSNLNFQAGQDIANTVLIRVGTGGGIRVFNGSYGSVQLIVDVTGYTRSGTPTAAGAVAAVTPTRIVDSRIGRQLPGPVPALATEDMQIGGQGGIPLGRVAGVVATVTVVDPQQSGYMTLWPSGSDQPGTSNLNFQAGQNIATTVIVPVSSDYALRLFNGSFGTVQVIIDVSGYILSGTPTATGTLWSPSPTRIADSRAGLQLAGETFGLQTAAVNTAVVGGAVAAVVTVTVVAPQAGGYVTVWSSGTNRPGTSNLNFQAGQNIATTVIVPVGRDGVIQLFNGSPGALHLIVDFMGYTLPTAPTAAGAVWAWGDGDRNQLGIGLQGAIWAPAQISGLSDITAVATGTGGFTGYALRSDGSVAAWGYAFFGELGNNGTTDSPVPVPVSGLNGVAAIAAGMFTGYALLGEGTVWAWGDGEVGQLGQNILYSTVPVQVSGLTHVTAIAGGVMSAYAVRDDGTVWAWGWGFRGELGNGGTTESAVPVQVPVPGPPGTTAVATVGYTTYALRGDGTVWAWGEGYGNLPVQVAGLTDITAIAGGNSTGYALRGDRTVWAWGRGGSGELGNGGTANSTDPVQVSGLTDITAIAGGYALRGDGTVWAWGPGDMGQLGNASHANSLVPAPIPGLANISAIASGGATAYAVTH